MMLDDIYDFLKAAGLASTHSAFSTDYLGHSPRYYDYLRCSGAPASLRSLLKLAVRLGDMAHARKAEPEYANAGDLAQQVMSLAVARCR